VKPVPELYDDDDEISRCVPGEKRFCICKKKKTWKVISHQNVKLMLIGSKLKELQVGQEL
jgi:hypothetical protein